MGIAREPVGPRTVQQETKHHCDYNSHSIPHRHASNATEFMRDNPVPLCRRLSPYATEIRRSLLQTATPSLFTFFSFKNQLGLLTGSQLNFAAVSSLRHIFKRSEIWLNNVTKGVK